MAKMWAGRFKKETDRLVNEFNASVSVDSRLYRQFTELARSRNAEPEELLLDYIRRTVEEAGKEEA